ncbi:unnamed protein product, partial [Mesorhabditis spiculigera]
MATESKPLLEQVKKAAPKILEAIIGWTIITFYTILVFFQLLWSRIRGHKLCHRELHQRPEILDKDWKHHYIQLATVRLHYVQAGEDDKPLMVLIHGFPEFWYSWRYQLEHFQKDYRVVAIDQRGYHESDRPMGVAEYTTKILASDIEQLIKKLGYKNAVVGGHDWGAMVAWHVALNHPQVVKKLIICNVPHPGVATHNMRTNWKQFLASWYIFFFQVPLFPEFLVSTEDYKMMEVMMRGKKGGLRLHPENFGPEEVEAWKYVFSQQGALTGPINYYRAALRYPSKTTLNDIVKPPTLVVWGTDDPFLIKEGAEQSISCCQNGRVAYVEGASHWVQQDDPVAVNRHIEEFLAEK